MSKAKFTVTIHPDGRKAYQAGVQMRDICKWEDGGEGRSATTFEENPSLSALYEVAYYASMRQKKFTGSLEEFKDQCDIEVNDDEPDETGPTPKGR